MSEPLKHVVRAQPPWRAEQRTECGRPVIDVAVAVDRAEAIAEWKRLGPQRAAFVYCMSCTNTANRYPTWESDPLSVLSRYFAPVFGHRAPERERLTHEARVIAALIEAHRDEFDEAMAGLGDVGDLTARRQRARRTQRLR